jgi:hypothetical protein
MKKQTPNSKQLPQLPPIPKQTPQRPGFPTSDQLKKALQQRGKPKVE